MKWFGRFLILLLLRNAFAPQAQAQVIQNNPEQQGYVNKDTATVNKLLSLSKKYLQSNPQKTIAYGEKALKLAKNLHYRDGITLAMTILARGYAFVSNNQRSLELRKKLLNLFQKTGNLAGQASVLYGIGNRYKFLGGYTKALDSYFQALGIYEQLEDKDKMAVAMKAIGKVYAAQGADSTAEHYYLQSLHTLRELSEKDYSKMTMAATLIGGLYQHLNKTDKALQYLELALVFAKKIPGKYNGHAITMTLANLGSLYETNQNYVQALTYNQQAFKIAQQTNSKILLGLNYENRAIIYKNMDSLRLSNKYYLKSENIKMSMGLLQATSMAESALAKNYIALKNYKQATEYALKALHNANKGGYPEQAVDALKVLVKVNERTAQYKNALKYQKAYQAVMDTLLSREKADQLLKLNTLYQTEKKEKQITLLQNETEKAKTLRIILIGGIVLVVIIGFLIFNQEHIRRRKNEALFKSGQALAAEQLKNTRLHEIQLQQEINMKNKELTTYALNVVQKNQTMEELNQKVRMMRKDADGNLLAHLNKLQHAIGHSLNLDNDWDEFRLYFEQVHSQFFTELNNRFPDLSNKELRLCALLKLNLSSKEMTTLLGISQGSVKMARYRLRKKLHLPSEEDLTAFLINLEKSVSGRAG